MKITLHICLFIYPVYCCPIWPNCMCDSVGLGATRLYTEMICSIVFFLQSLLLSRLIDKLPWLRMFVCCFCCCCFLLFHFVFRRIWFNVRIFFLCSRYTPQTHPSSCYMKLEYVGPSKIITIIVTHISVHSFNIAHSVHTKHIHIAHHIHINPFISLNKNPTKMNHIPIYKPYLFVFLYSVYTRMFNVFIFASFSIRFFGVNKCPYQLLLRTTKLLMTNVVVACFYF